MTDTNPIFIVGAPRSGTTLLEQMLTNHPQLYVFNETLFYDFAFAHRLEKIPVQDMVTLLADHLIGRIAVRIVGQNSELRDFGGRFTNTQAAKIDSRFQAAIQDLDRSTTPADIFEKFMRIVAEQKGKSRWGEKTPNHVFHIYRILADFPLAKIIHVVRHPRSFLKSYKFAWRQAGAKEETRKLYHPIVTSLLWRRSIKAFEQAKAVGPVNSFFTVRYEDLISQPDTTLRTICSFIEESFYPEMLHVKESNTSFRKGNESLSPVEINVCEQICSRYLEKYGYKNSKEVKISPLLYVRSAVTLLPFLFRALPVVKRHFGSGIFQYLRARKLS